MATTILEQTRQLHEDIEVGEKVASRLLAERSKRKPKFRPVYDHSMLETLIKIQDSSRRVLELYADKDSLRKEEIEIFGGLKRFNPNLPDGTTQEVTDDGRTVWLNFYDQLKIIKEQQRLNPTADDPFAGREKDVPTLSAEAIERCSIDLVFNANESMGRRVDMMSLFLEYTNLPKVRKHREDEFVQSEISRIKKKLQNAPKKLTAAEIQAQLEEESKLIVFQEIDYITYLRVFDEFRSIPRWCKYRNSAYTEYLQHVIQYLQSFLRRLNPLTNHEKIKQHLNSEFEMAWQKKAVPAWEKLTHDMPLYSLPTDHLFVSDKVLASHMEGKKYNKALSMMQSLTLEEQQSKLLASEDHDKSVANLEFIIQRYRDILASVIQRTIEYLQKKQSRTLRELELEGEESDGRAFTKVDISHNPSGDDDAVAMMHEAADLDDSDAESDEGRPVYNPLNLPLGWDGKPIPFWLYKLHGLGVEYKCEICGNYSYWGRRAFERHFQEWRHAFGMRCLKIPNTVHFKEITKIEDAILLYEQMKKEAEAQKIDQDIECEDADGNVMSARAYEDLRRQGLI